MTNKEANTQPDIKRDAHNLFNSTTDFLRALFDLQKGIDKEGTILYIQNNKSMLGANVWMLMCSIAIASLGLDLNSPAVIIGAMLISPLMSPILGVGLGIGTNDRQTLSISMKNFGTSIVIALLVSFLYFWINPLGHFAPTREILDRTEPTLLAGLVAIFGGVAGIISVSRKDQSNAMPGVAIATALMPPLCVSGYGLANANWKIFIDSFYLFFLNSFFIAISTFVLIRYMNFPFKKYQNQSEGRRTAIWITVVSIILILPSVYILHDVVQTKRQEQVVARFVNNHFGNDDDPTSVGYQFNTADTASTLILKLLGRRLEDQELQEYQGILSQRGVENVRILAMQDEATDLSVYEELSANLNSYQNIIDQFSRSQEQMSAADQELNAVQVQLDSIRGDTLPIHRMNQQVSALLPQVERLAYGHVYEPSENGLQRVTYVFVHWAPHVSKRSREEDKLRLALYLKGESGYDHIRIVDAPQTDS